MNEIKARQQTKLLQNNGTESLKGGQGYSTIVASRGVAWRGAVWHRVARGVAGRGERDGEMERNRSGVRRAWLCLAAAGAEACVGGVCWRRARQELVDCGGGGEDEGAFEAFVIGALARFRA